MHGRYHMHERGWDIYMKYSDASKRSFYSINETCFQIDININDKLLMHALQTKLFFGREGQIGEEWK